MILPKVSSLVSRVLESVPPVQGSGLANLWSGTKILQVVCYGKNEIKTNSHEQETKDEKIRFSEIAKGTQTVASEGLLEEVT